MVYRTSSPIPRLTWWMGSRRRILSDELRLFLCFLAVLTVLCCAVYAYVRIANQIAVTQERIAELRARYYQVERENANLVYEIGPYINISRIEARAREIGYEPPKERMLVRAPMPQERVAQAPAAAEPAQRVAWWQEILDWASRRLRSYTPAYAQAKR